MNSLKEKEDESAGLRESMRSSVNSRKSRESVAPSVVEVEEEEDEDDEGTVIGARRDSLVSELLSDGDVEMSGL